MFAFFILIWNEAVIRPMLNTLLVLYVLCGARMGLAIIAFTVLVRVAILPFTLKQLRQQRALTGLQARVQELRQRHPGDTAHIAQESRRLYRQSGVNPLGCLVTWLVQLPVFFGLYRALVLTLFDNPEDLVNLAGKLYSWVDFVPIHAAPPVNREFLWLDLSQPDPTPIVLPLLVAATFWVQQRMSQPPATATSQQSNQQMMLWMMPIFMGVLCLAFPSGPPLYWVVSNLIGIALQYCATGWGSLFPLFPRSGPPAGPPAHPATSAGPAPAPSSAPASPPSRRSNRRRGRRAGRRRQQRRERV